MKMMNALIWLRFKLLTKNKMFLFMALMPYILVYLYGFMFDGDGHMSGLFIVNTCLSFSFAGSSLLMVLTTIAEDKEKYNLKTFILSGTGSFIYIFSSIIVPLILGVASVILLPIITGVEFGENYYQYLLISFFTLVIHIFLGLLIALFTDTQMNASLSSFPLLCISSVLPMIANGNDQVKKICDILYVGAQNNFFMKIISGETLIFLTQDISILVSWSIVLFALNIFLYKKAKKGGFSLRIKTFKKEEVSI